MYVLKFNYFSYVMYNFKKQDYFTFSPYYLFIHILGKINFLLPTCKWRLDFKRISTNKKAFFQDPDEFKDLHAHHQFTEESS